jgi:hypothetical protein
MKALFGYTASDASPGYIILRDATDGPNFIMQCQLNEMWNLFHNFADAQFINEFATTSFNQRYWEMYLGATLLKTGYSLNKAKHGPDLCVKLPENNVWIEAVCPTIGQGQSPDQVPRLVPNEEGGGFQKAPSDQIILRLLGCISDKSKIHQRYLNKGIVRQQDPFLIAVSGCDIDHWLSHPSSHEYLLRTLFPLGEPVMHFDKQNFQPAGHGFQYSNGLRKRSSDKILPKAFFYSSNSEDVSAVLWSSRRPGHLHDTNWGSDFVLIHNPRADSKLPDAFLCMGREIKADQDQLNVVDYRAGDAPPT